MPICAPCRVPHTEQAWEDATTGRRGLERRCYCQHKPPRSIAAQPGPGPECETPKPDTPHDVAGTRHTTTITHEQGEQQ